MYKLILIFFIVAIGFTVAEAQTYEMSKSSELIFSGTSSLHDWTMTAENVKSSGTFTVENNQIISVSDLTVTIAAESLKSGKSGMDDNAYKALKTNKHKSITFTITSVKNEGRKLIAYGKLTIAGATNNIQIKTDYTIGNNGQITISGSVPLKMTDYKIDPPTAMFGTIKTGNDITVNFKSTFIKESI